MLQVLRQVALGETVAVAVAQAEVRLPLELAAQVALAYFIYITRRQNG
jgi:hypothetical protein